MIEVRFVLWIFLFCFVCLFCIIIIIYKLNIFFLSIDHLCMMYFVADFVLFFNTRFERMVYDILFFQKKNATTRPLLNAQRRKKRLVLRVRLCTNTYDTEKLLLPNSLLVSVILSMFTCWFVTCQIILVKITFKSITIYLASNWRLNMY